MSSHNTSFYNTNQIHTGFRYTPQGEAAFKSPAPCLIKNPYSVERFLATQPGGRADLTMPIVLGEELHQRLVRHGLLPSPEAPATQCSGLLYDEEGAKLYRNGWLLGAYLALLKEQMDNLNIPFLIDPNLCHNLQTDTEVGDPNDQGLRQNWDFICAEIVKLPGLAILTAAREKFIGGNQAQILNVFTTIDGHIKSITGDENALNFPSQRELSLSEEGEKHQGSEADTTGSRVAHSASSGEEYRGIGGLELLPQADSQVLIECGGHLKKVKAQNKALPSLLPSEQPGLDSIPGRATVPNRSLATSTLLPVTTTGGRGTLTRQQPKRETPRFPTLEAIASQEHRVGKLPLSQIKNSNQNRDQQSQQQANHGVGSGNSDSQNLLKPESIDSQGDNPYQQILLLEKQLEELQNEENVIKLSTVALQPTLKEQEAELKRLVMEKRYKIVRLSNDAQNTRLKAMTSMREIAQTEFYRKLCEPEASLEQLNAETSAQLELGQKAAQITQNLLRSEEQKYQQLKQENETHQIQHEQRKLDLESLRGRIAQVHARQEESYSNTMSRKQFPQALDLTLQSMLSSLAQDKSIVPDSRALKEISEYTNSLELSSEAWLNTNGYTPMLSSVDVRKQTLMQKEEENRTSLNQQLQASKGQVQSLVNMYEEKRRSTESNKDLLKNYKEYRHVLQNELLDVASVDSLMREALVGTVKYTNDDQIFQNTLNGQFQQN